MKKLFLAVQILLLPLNLLASNQIFEAGTRVKLAMTSDGGSEAFWLFDLSNHYFSYYPDQSAAAAGYLSYLEEGSFSISSLGNNRFSNQYSSTGYGMGNLTGTSTPFAGSSAISRSATLELTSPFTANYTGTRTDTGGTTDFYGNLIIYPAQDYAPNVLPVGSVWSNDGYYYKDPGLIAGDDYGTFYSIYSIQSSNSLQLNDPEYGLANGSYTYTKLGPNLGSISISSSLNSYSASLSLFFVSPTEVHYYGNTTDSWGNYTDWGTLSVNNPSNYSPPVIFSAPSTLPQNQILQIAGTNSDLSLDLAGGTWTDASGASGSFTYTYAVQSGGVAGLTLNRTIQNVPASPEHFALRFTDDGVGEVVYSSLDGSQSFNLVDAPTWELYDDFSGSTIDAEKWETLAWGGGEEPFSLNGKVFFSGSQNTNTDVQGTLKEEYLAYYNNLGITELGPEPDSHSMLHFKNANFQNTHGVEFELSVSSTHQNAATGIGLFCYDEYQPNYGFFLDAWKSSGDGKLKLEFGIVGDDVLPGDQRFEYISDEWGYLDFIEIQYDTSYKIAYLMKNDTLCFYLDGVEVGQISYASSRPHSIATFRGVNESGDNFEATIDNVKILQESYEPPLPAVESYGNTELLEDSSGYYAGSASTPLLYNGNQLGPTAGYSALGVDLHNGHYRLVIFNGIQYLVNDFNTSGVSQGIFSAVSDMSAEEIKLSQDLDGNGHVGALPIAPPASIAEMQFEFSIGNGIIASAPFQEFYRSDGVMNLGFSNSIFERVPYTYNNGVISFPQLEKELRLTFAGADSGTFEYYDVDDLINEQLEYSGTFAVVTPSLEAKTDWQQTEFFNSALSTIYWNVIRREVDSLVYDDGELNFIFGSPNSPVDTEINYARTLPMSEDWQVVVDDIYAAPALNDFKIEVDIEIVSPEFELEIFYEDNGGGRRFGVNVFQASSNPMLAIGENGYAYVTENEDARISGGGNIRVTHIASTRELIFEYQPEGANDWSELANFNLTTGAFQGQHNTYGSNFTGGLVNAISDRLSIDIEAFASVATQVGDLEIGGIEIVTYTPPTTPVDADGDGLDDSVETNTGIYVSPSDTGTDPQLEDSTGDGFSDGEVVSAGLSPVIDYSSLLEIVRNNSERFGLENTNSTVDMNLSSLRLERTGNGPFNMNFDLEMSTDLQTWAPHSNHTIEISVPDQSKTFMRLNVK